MADIRLIPLDHVTLIMKILILVKIVNAFYGIHDDSKWSELDPV